MNQIVRIAALPITPKNLFYFYRAWVERVTDADTAHLMEFDFGRMHFEKQVSLRFCHYDGTYLDAWEIFRRPSGLTDAQWAEHRAKGLAGTEFVRGLLPKGTMIILLTNRDLDGTFRDLAGAVFIPQVEGDYIDVAESLRVSGHLKS